MIKDKDFVIDMLKADIKQILEEDPKDMDGLAGRKEKEIAKLMDAKTNNIDLCPICKDGQKCCDIIGHAKGWTVKK